MPEEGLLPMKLGRRRGSHCCRDGKCAAAASAGESGSCWPSATAWPRPLLPPMSGLAARPLAPPGNEPFSSFTGMLRGRRGPPPELLSGLVADDRAAGCSDRAAGCMGRPSSPALRGPLAPLEPSEEIASLSMAIDGGELMAAEGRGSR
jgi:hypothetical protein